MNEVEKMYENAEPNRDCNLCKHFTECPMKHTQCEDCENFVYPPFTAEKQLEIVKFMLHKGVYYDTDGDTYWFHYTDEIENATYRPFEEAIAEFINVFWQDLRDTDKVQIKNVLEQPLGAVYKIDWMYVRKVYPYFLERRY